MKPRKFYTKHHAEHSHTYTEHELTYDKVHALIDEFAEMNLRGGDPTLLILLIQHHLDMYPDCREE